VPAGGLANGVKAFGAGGSSKTQKISRDKLGDLARYAERR
jgi:hypothetical protein